MADARRILNFFFEDSVAGSVQRYVENYSSQLQSANAKLLDSTGVWFITSSNPGLDEASESVSHLKGNKAIKDAGGITFAEEESSAKLFGMPSSKPWAHAGNRGRIFRGLRCGDRSEMASVWRDAERRCADLGR